MVGRPVHDGAVPSGRGESKENREKERVRVVGDGLAVEVE
jgi:hypothetical protein